MADDQVAGAASKRAVPWKGRPRVPDARHKVLSLRCTPAEFDALSAKADRAGLKIGPYMRAVILGSAGVRAMRQPPVNQVMLAKLLGEIGKLGSNINQLARAANSGATIPAEHMVLAVSAIEDMRSAVLKALGRGD